MQRRMLAAIPLLIGLGLACSDSTGVTADDLVGTWNATEFIFSDFGDPVMDFDVLGMGGSVTATFTANGAFQLIVDVIEPDTATGTWALPASDRLLLIGSSSDSITFDVGLSGTTLTLYTNDVMFDFGNGEIPAQLNAIFEKQ